MDLEIKNGIVFDPINKIKGEKMNILINDGRVVEKLKGKPEVIDASDKIIMPGGIEIHSHFAGGKETAGRLLRPEDGARVTYRKMDGMRAGSGFSMPSSFTAGYLYAKMGYTMANDFPCLLHLQQAIYTPRWVIPWPTLQPCPLSSQGILMRSSAMSQLCPNSG
jgi:formylmethanofuran dehydrogenase subunit A